MKTLSSAMHGKYDPAQCTGDRPVAPTGRAPGCDQGRSPQRNRRSIRLQGYDYSQAGAYFVTLCTHNRECLFGEIVNGEMRLNDAGQIVAGEWLKTAEIRDEIELDAWVVMPNHFHGILVITDGRGDRPVAPVDGVAPMNGTTISGEQGDRRVAPTGPQPRSIGAVMAGFKSAVTKRINELRQSPGAKLWQRNYWEHIVRNEPELNRIREYIHNNPAQWELDKLHPSPLYGRPAGRPNEVREPIAEYGMEA
ncbi:uncharacterized protein sS8_3174 [Methylocaldum marinum]|uniref:Transposase IS200-like domain-containing protein n=1 Tax=Methylocaldum marinum TaxID=1432792 RepID=A0A250KU20_9GAMM|nr:transposase [Methylocaldum marinum]BBA35117.1 uncharacterized protein sS8_3174 [Methylocaldum marinum]